MNKRDLAALGQGIWNWKVGKNEDWGIWDIFIEGEGQMMGLKVESKQFILLLSPHPLGHETNTASLKMG